MLVYSPNSPSKHRTPNNKHPLLLPPDPLDNLIRALRQCRATRIRRRHGIQFEQRGTPRERNRRCIRFVVDLEGRWFIVYIGVEFVVEVEESGLVESAYACSKHAFMFVSRASKLL
jgi:hypothetical protein